jgi:hypothetical protein
MFVAWAVRFMIAGGPTGTVEKYYAGRAAEVWKGDIPSATDLAKAMNKYLPSDEAFRAAFATARVSKTYLARYFLRSLEQKHKGEAEPFHVVNDNETVVNLEHVLPERPSPAWAHIDKEVADAYCRRLGNMVLLRARANSQVGNDSFKAKKKVYKVSGGGMELTKQVLSCEQWGPDEIDERQKKLADLAVETWPLASPR